jgi:hypothetical protein
MASMGSPARSLSMARCRRCSCVFALGDSCGACGHPCQIALCSRCHGTFVSVGAAHQTASVVRTGHRALSCLRVAAACRGVWAWSAPAGNGVRATGVGRHAAGGGAPMHQRLPRGPSGLPPRAPYGGGPSLGVATGGMGQSAWAPPGLNRPTSMRADSGRPPRPSPEVEDHARHAGSTTAPRSPRCSARCAGEEHSLRGAAAPPSAPSCDQSGAAHPCGPTGLDQWPVGRPVRPDDVSEARWSCPQPTAPSPRPLHSQRAPRP